VTEHSPNRAARERHHAPRQAAEEPVGAGAGRDHAPPTQKRRPQQARARETRASIVSAAIECFERAGYDATTTASIATQAEVGVGTVYTYFKNKREILLEIVSSTMADMAETIVRHLDPAHWEGADPRTTTRFLIDLIFHTQDLRPGMQRIIWERFFRDDDVRAAIEAIWARTREAIKLFLDAVEQEGQLRDIDRDSATHVIQNAVQWNASRAFEAGDSERIDLYAAATADMISRFVFRDPDR